MLQIKNLHTYYGAIHALKGIDMEVKEGEVVSLIGSNGAGKTTLLNSIMGICKASKGNISFKDKDITNIYTHKLNSMGIGISPEGREVFPALSVEENLRLGAYIVRNKNDILRSYERIYKQCAGTLSGGEQQMLAVGRALMSEPSLLLLDEPSLGLAPNFVMMIFDMVKEINKQGVTILLIEQNANMALQVSNRAYVLENGVVSLSGDSKDIAKDSRVMKAYLGLG